MVSAIRPPCPYCGAQTVHLNGVRKGGQIFKCPLCGKQFRGDGAVDGRHFSPEVIGAAISSYYDGKSLRRIVEEMRSGGVEGNAPLSHDAVGRWVIHYTEYALRLTAGLKFGGWGFCYLFSRESSTRNGRQWWALLALSTISDYILACHVTTEWNEEIVANFMSYVMEVMDLTEGPPVFATGTSRVYDLALHKLDPSPFHFVMPGYAGSEEERIPGGPEGAMMRQIQRALRMKSPERAALHLKGWALSHNHRNGELIQSINVHLEAQREPPIPRVHIPSWTEVVRRRAQ